MFTNIETWSKISKNELEELEKMQRNILISILELPPSTPYFGLLAELGIWPVEQLLEYKRLILLHQILTSKDTRFIKQIILSQIEDTWPGCWTEKTKEICTKYDIIIDDIKETNKDKFKVIIKGKSTKN